MTDPICKQLKPHRDLLNVEELARRADVDPDVLRKRLIRGSRARKADEDERVARIIHDTFAPIIEGTTMQHGIIIGDDGFRKGTATIQKRASGDILIDVREYDRLEPTDERTQPEGYIVCDVYERPQYEGDDGKQIWQIAVSADHLAHLTG